jgi:HJR/Mrr/RecB family endonuclease
MSPSRRRGSSSGDDAAMIGFVAVAGVVLLAIAWPYFLGTYLAVRFGADNPSPARTITGWVLEAAWLAFLACIPFYLLAKRSANQKLALAQAAEQKRIAAQARAAAAERAAEQERIAAKARAAANERAAETARIAAQARAAADEQAAAEARAWQRERWTEDVNLAGDDLARVLAVDGIDTQVKAENAHIEAEVRSLENILTDGLPVPSNIARNSHLAGEPDGIARYVKSVLTSMRVPSGCGSDAKIAYSVASRQLVVEYELPSIKVVPAAKWYRYVETRKKLADTRRPVSQVKSLYGGAIAQLSLLCIAYTFGADTKRDVDVVVLNGVVDTVDPRSGKPVRPCLISVRVTRDTFDEIDLHHVDPLACLKHLSASVSRSPTELAPVRPVVEFSMVDPRFISETDTLSGMDGRPNLMQLTPSDFESLIQNLFTKMGLETKQTRASRDGGVDCVAYDTRPIFGGKVVIQAKRYKNTVGVSAVRDLFGTLQNEGASKGILVTTSGYGKASFEFAQNKPIELIDGGNLLYLLEEHAGIKAKIEVPDDWRDPVPDAGEAAL